MLGNVMTYNNSNKLGGRLLIITYHYVREKGGAYPGIHPVSEKELSSHISKLKQKYRPVSIEQALNFFSGIKSLKHDSFLITFDDGLQDHYRNARHVLDRHNIKGVFFVPTLPVFDKKAPAVHKIHWLRANISPDKFVVLLNEMLPDKWSNLKLNKKDQKKASEMHIHDNFQTQVLKFSLNFIIPYDVVNQTLNRMFIAKGIDEADFCRTTFMNAEQIFRLNMDGHVIAMHGHSHVAFTSFNEGSLDCDVEKNSTLLENILGKRPTWLSYPYGRPDAIPNNAERLCKKHKINATFSLISGINKFGDSSLALKRITPNEINTYLNDIV
jgi:peptidoglycan/xylan/chitin deacetylase (PgdA/CDA1 family)